MLNWSRPQSHRQSLLVKKHEMPKSGVVRGWLFWFSPSWKIVLVQLQEEVDKALILTLLQLSWLSLAYLKRGQWAGKQLLPLDRLHLQLHAGETVNTNWKKRKCPNLNRHLQRHPAIIRNQMYAFFNVISEQKELVTAQLFSHYEILHFCFWLYFFGFSCGVPLLCVVPLAWHEGQWGCVAGWYIFVWLWCPCWYIWYIFECGCPRYIFLPVVPLLMYFMHICVAVVPLIYICLAVVPLLILSSSTVWISLALYPVGAPCVAVGAPVWLPSISSPHREWWLRWITFRMGGGGKEIIRAFTFFRSFQYFAPSCRWLHQLRVMQQ